MTTSQLKTGEEPKPEMSHITNLPKKIDSVEYNIGITLFKTYLYFMHCTLCKLSTILSFHCCRANNDCQGSTYLAIYRQINIENQEKRKIPKIFVY
jgi:hypothetical protein